MDDILQHDLVEGQLGDEPFQLQVLLPQLLQLPGFTRQHPAVGLLPAVSSRHTLLADWPDCAAELALRLDRKTLSPSLINRPLFYYCRREGITFTRSRARKNNDSAHVEQNNGAILRQLVGDDRFAFKAAYA